MNVNDCRYEGIAIQLGIEPSSITKIIRETSRFICESFPDVIRLPRMTSEVHKTMKGFQGIAGLPYCVGAIDGTHIPWLRCPEEQFFEHRCFKGYTSIVLFACVDANKKFTYVNIGHPGVNGDSRIFQNSSLKSKMDNGTWPGKEIPSLFIDSIQVIPCLVGDGAFRLSPNVLKSFSTKKSCDCETKKLCNYLQSATRMPVECAFGMLKNRFSSLKSGVRVWHEDDNVFFILACVILHNLCLT